MNVAILTSTSHEKGWGTFFDVGFAGGEYRFSVSAETLQTRGLRHRTKKVFPDVFEANIPKLLKVAQTLIETGRINSTPDIGGTEILPEHIMEIENA